MRDGSPSLEALHAQLNVQRMQTLASAHLQWALAVSLPIWIAALWGRVPALVAWMAVLAQGYCLALAAGYTALQERWTRRGARLGEPSGRVVVHTLWSDLDELRAALWSAAGVISLVPWFYVACGRVAPAALVHAALACCAAVMLLLAMLSSFGRTLPPAAAPRDGSWGR